MEESLRERRQADLHSATATASLQARLPPQETIP